MRKYTKKLTQHLQIHVCKMYIGLPVGCVRPGGYSGVSYVWVFDDIWGVNTPKQDFVVVGGDGYFTVTEETH